MGTLVVMLDVRERHFEQNPYIWQLVTVLRERFSDSVTIRGFSWRRALFGRVDILHAHWPEFLSRDTRFLRRVLKSGLTIAFIARLRLTGIPIVRTRHNEVPHEKSARLQDALTSFFDSHASGVIHLKKPEGDVEKYHSRLVEMTIPHPDYSKWIEHLGFAPKPFLGVQSRIDLLIFGILSPYKRVEKAIALFEEISRIHPNCHLTIAGAPANKAYAEKIGTKVKSLSGVSFRPERIDDDTLCQLVSSSTAVLVPYDRVGNSGVLFYSLTLNRPLLVSDEDSLSLLQDQFGARWVRGFSPEDLLELPSPGSVFQTERDRTPECCAERHRELYLSVVEMARLKGDFD